MPKNVITKPRPCECGKGKWRQQSGADISGNRRYTCTACRKTIKVDQDGRILPRQRVAPGCPKCAAPWKSTCTIGDRQYRTCPQCGQKGITNRETGEILDRIAPGRKIESIQAALMAGKRWAQSIRPCPACAAMVWHVICSNSGRQYRTCRTCGHKGITDAKTGAILPGKPNGLATMSRENRKKAQEKSAAAKRAKKPQHKPQHKPIEIMKHADKKQILPPVGLGQPLVKMPAKALNTSAWSRIDDLRLKRECVNDDPLFG